MTVSRHVPLIELIAARDELRRQILDLSLHRLDVGRPTVAFTVDTLSEWLLQIEKEILGRACTIADLYKDCIHGMSPREHCVECDNDNDPGGTP